VDRLKIDIHYRDRAILYRNSHGKFVDISESAGPGIMERHSSRGLAFADYDNDGSVEAVVNNQNEAPSLLRLAAKSSNHYIELKLEGVKSNRSAIGARVRVTAGGLVQTAEVRSGGSYLSQSDLRLHFGLAGAVKVDKVEIAWPGGGTQVETALSADRIIAIRER
jgi:enediyne biosynthesis protein E4